MAEDGNFFCVSDIMLFSQTEQCSLALAATAEVAGFYNEEAEVDKPAF